MRRTYTYGGPGPWVRGVKCGQRREKEKRIVCWEEDEIGMWREEG